MKRILLFLIFIASAIGLNAQQLVAPGSHWFDGRNMYLATEKFGEIQLLSLVGGKLDTIDLVPIPDQAGWFTLKGVDSNSLLLNQNTMVSLTEDNGRKMLVIYKGGMVDKLLEQTELSAEEIIAERWYPTVEGKYTCKTPDGRTVEMIVERDSVIVDGVNSHYKMITSNGAPLDVVAIYDGPAKGVWHFVRTVEGFNVYKARLNETGVYEELYDEIDDKLYEMTWDDPTKSRWSYLSDVFIIPIHYKKPTLRLIRNHILAEHGYVFQSKGLQKYFKEMPWYKPGKNNDAINLNFIEQMNISRIQGEEAKLDSERIRVTEEEPGIKGVSLE